tara:strand:- start:3438 stop:3716 length:279 start_codon:yes stop_codon:yes gene_type:complete
VAKSRIDPPFFPSEPDQDDPKAKSTYRELCDNFNKTFSTPAGQRVLEYWEKQFMSQPVARPDIDAQVAFFREGQNSIIRDALVKINRSKEGK